MKYNIKTKILIVVLFIIMCGFIFLSVDYMRIKTGNKSIFTVPVQYYKDGGTIYRIGIGYGVFEWKILAKQNDNIQNYGVNVGDEIVLFPKCYYAPFDHDIKPKIPLLFIEE